MEIKSIIRMAYGILAGSLLYVPLVVIPFAGPLYSGIFTGRKAGTMPIAGFFAGFLSGVIGYLLWALVIFPFFNVRPQGLLQGIFWLVFLAWNILSFFLAGIGGVMGSILSYSEGMRPGYPNGKNRQEDSYERAAPETSAPTFVICPSCGTSNPEDSTHCRNCGKDIR
jgi:Na+/proline symporter